MTRRLRSAWRRVFGPDRRRCTVTVQGCQCLLNRRHDGDCVPEGELACEVEQFLKGAA